MTAPLPRILIVALLTIGIMQSACTSDSPSETSSPGDSVTLFTYFEGNGETGVFLKRSEDGLDFETVNDGEPIFTPPTSWPEDQQLTRDPSVVYHQGTFHMVWTTNWEGRVFGYARSPDMQTWTDTTLVRPFSTERPAEQQPKNIWAPEVHYDPVEENFFVVFSSTLPSRLGDDAQGADTHGNNHRMYVVRTEDFQSFTDAELLYDPGFSSIDGQLAYQPAGQAPTGEPRWIMAFKHERLPEHGGKNIRLVTRDPKSNTFSDYGEPIVGPGSGLNEDWAEGPTLLQTNDGNWRLYWDAYRQGYYGLAQSPDLNTWTDITDSLNTGVEDPRHGAFFHAPADALGDETH